MKIQLPGFVIADLYRNSLVITDDVMLYSQPEETDMPAEPEAAPVLYLGDNKKGISILVNDSRNRFADEESLQLLINMLSALQLTLADVAIINIHETPFTYKELIAQFQTQICLMFHVDTQQIQLPFQMPDYKVQSFDNCRFVSSASLDKMKGSSKDSKLEKTKLWMCLKTLFESL